ncbi:MAG: nucleotidyl transferase AbiEii/AbiGii toxin family protein [Lachnospiraceae bacterium]
MHLHHDKEAFEELVIGAANELHIPANVIEKDYFVTLTLKKLSTKLKDMVFKGGTSLTKCYQLLDRFSEDIDISYTAESGVPGDARKKQLKKAVVSTLESLELTINNLEYTRSRRNYNCYCASYPSIYDNSPFLKQELVLETYVALLPFPTVTRMVDNYLYRFLKKINRLDIAEQYDLMPFPITTQAIERTLVDKVFAICDYYLDGKTEKHSRHLYDIHKIYTNMEIPNNFKDLIVNVRSLRSELAVCPSAKDGVDINKVLQEIVDTEAYKNDYEEITSGLLFTPLEYDEVITSIKAIIQLNLF